MSNVRETASDFRCHLNVNKSNLVPIDYMPACSLSSGHNTMFESTAPAEPPWIKQQLRVPREDDSLFSRPDLAAALQLARSNHQLLSEPKIDMSCRSLQLLREWSRREVLAAASEYTTQLTGLVAAKISADALLLVGGHQPALFHPGVWVKNFALGAMAQASGGIGLNLIVDNDTIASRSIRVPVGNRQSPRVELVPFDDDQPAQPWEEARIANDEVFASFGDRVAARMKSWMIQPLLNGMWPDAVDAANATGSLRDAMTAARHRQEHRWGCANLELPISRLCELDPFLWFASHLLVELPRFREIHNEVLGEFRQINRIRSRTHPVPELSSEPDGWLEAPFWVWRAGDDRRQRTFARQVGGEIELSDGSETFARLPLAPGGEACCAVEALRELPAQGIRLRTRALTTTLFSRLCLSDLFVHGIGGSKYDEMTDRIIYRFYKLQAPSFLTLSATLHLPLGKPYLVSPADVVGLQSQLRDLEYNSDRHLTGNGDAEVDALIAEKQRLIQDQQAWNAGTLTRKERRREARHNHARFRRFRDIGEQLARSTADLRRRILAEEAEVAQQLESNAILQNREFSFAVYPEEKLRGFMTGLSVE